MKKITFVSAFLAMIGAAMRVSASDYGHRGPTPTRNHKRKPLNAMRGQPGAKLAKKAADGTLTCRHGKPIQGRLAI